MTPPNAAGLPPRMDAAFEARCIEGAPADEILRAVRPKYEVLRSHGDPEPKYWSGEMFSYCGLSDMAMDLVRWSLEGGYCPYPAMLESPLLANLRSDPGFAELRALGEACHESALRMIRENPLPRDGRRLTLRRSLPGP